MEELKKATALLYLFPDTDALKCR